MVTQHPQLSAMSHQSIHALINNVIYLKNVIKKENYLKIIIYFLVS